MFPSISLSPRQIRWLALAGALILAATGLRIGLSVADHAHHAHALLANRYHSGKPGPVTLAAKLLNRYHS